MSEVEMHMPVIGIDKKIQRKRAVQDGNSAHFKDAVTQLERYRMIAENAYFKSLDERRKHKSDIANWLEAEIEVEQRLQALQV